MTDLSARRITPDDAEWPDQLADLGDDQPNALWVRGAANLAEISAQSITVTGSRASTTYGDAVASDIAQGLARQGFSVATGGGYGIDSAATRAALSWQNTPTIVVQASGIDLPYPSPHRNLIDAVANNGIVVTAEEPGAKPQRDRFLYRARLLAALTQGSVIVEACVRSGALTVARSAREFERFVGAVPGPVTSAASTGVHQLLKTGTVTLVTSAEEVVAGVRD